MNDTGRFDNYRAPSCIKNAEEPPNQMELRNRDGETIALIKISGVPGYIIFNDELFIYSRLGYGYNQCSEASVFVVPSNAIPEFTF